MTDQSRSGDPKEKLYWLDQAGNVDRLVRGLYAICALLVLADLFYHKEVHFAFEGWFGFFAWYGFALCVFLVLAAKQIRRLVKRDESYYD